jgi:hypothetical protein
MQENENEVDIARLQQKYAPETSSNDSEEDESLTELDEIFDIIFSSSKSVLGNIKSIGVKYGDSLDNPDHMMVVFPNEVFGFQSWNNQKKKCRWKYHRSAHELERNGVKVPAEEAQRFFDFIQEGVAAMNDEKVAFSRDITKKEITDIQ